MVAPLLIALVVLLYTRTADTSDAAKYGWRVGEPVPKVVDYFGELSERIENPELLTSCNVERVDHNSIDQETFRKKYEYEGPVILTGYSAKHNEAFRKQCGKDAMLDKWGDETIILSTANAHSYEKKHVSLRWYIENVVSADSNQCSAFGNDDCLAGRDSWYWFGNHRTDFPGWNSFLEEYSLPDYIDSPEEKVAFSFGVGSPFSGVPFHIHGKVFAESIIGRKRWFLAPPDKKPQFHPDQSTSQWLKKTIEFDKSAVEGMTMCDVDEGEVLFIPSMWWHSTLNLDESVFISAFVSE